MSTEQLRGAGPMGPIGVISVADLAAIVAREPATQVIDVRTPEEFAEVRAATAVNLPLDRISPEAVAALGASNTAQPIYLICRSGARSMRAAEFLRAAGYAKLWNVAGGTLAWCAEGLPTKADAP